MAWPDRSVGTGEPSFADFYERVTGERLPVPEGFDQVKQRVHQMLMQPAAALSHTTEPAMQEATPPLLRIGGVMLEDTSRVAGWTIVCSHTSDGARRCNWWGGAYATDEKAQTFERFCFEWHEALHPALAVRFPVTNDPDVLRRGQQLPYGLPAYRLMPYNVAGFVDFKRGSNPLDSGQTISQLAEYTDRLLRSDFRRCAAFAAATNGRKVMFVCTKFSTGTTEVLRSAVIDDSNGLQLATFLTTAPHLLAKLQDWIPFPVVVCQPMEALGRGSTGFVMEVRVVAYFINYFANTDVAHIWRGPSVTAARVLLLSAFSMLKLTASEAPGTSRAADNLFEWASLRLRLPVGWSQLLMHLQAHGEHDDEVDGLLQSHQRIEAPIAWVHTVEQRIFGKLVRHHPVRGDAFLQAMREERWNEPVVLKCSEESLSVEWERHCLEWLAMHAADASFPRLVGLASLATNSEFEHFAFYAGLTRVVATRPRFAPVTTKVSRSMLKNAWALLSQIHAVGLIHCDIRRPNMMWLADEKKPVFIDWGFARFHFADSYVKADILEEFQEQRAHMLKGGLASTRMGLITASAPVLAAAGSGVDVPLGCPMYPADDAVALIKLGIQMLRKNAGALQNAPPSGNKAIHTWEGWFQNKDLRPVATCLERITRGREMLRPDELTTFVEDAIEALPFP